MVKCTKCSRTIVPGCRYVVGKRGGKYHISCSSELKTKSYAFTKNKKKK